MAMGSAATATGGDGLDGDGRDIDELDGNVQSPVFLQAALVILKKVSFTPSEIFCSLPTTVWSYPKRLREILPLLEGSLTTFLPIQYAS